MFTETGLAIYTALLALFTLLLTIAAFLQWRVLQGQRKVMSGQLSTMDRQLEEMKVTRDVLRTLVTQAAQNAAIGQEAATAAKQSADAIINSERAWIMVDIQKKRGESTFAMEGQNSASPIIKTTLLVELKCKNEGRSPAWIIEKRGRVNDGGSYLPLEPDLPNADVIEVKPQPISP